MSDKPAVGPNLRIVHGGRDTPSPAPRPPSPHDQQVRIQTLEHLNTSLTEEVLELKQQLKAARKENKVLVAGNIELGARRIIFFLQNENFVLRERITELEAELEPTAADAQAAKAEYARLEAEYEKLLASYEERLSAESLVEYLNDELNAANAELSAKREELANYKSAESVKAMFIDELKDLDTEVKKYAELILSDMSTDNDQDILTILLSHSYILLQSEDPQRQAFGFKLQSFVFEHQSKKRGTI